MDNDKLQKINEINHNLIAKKQHELVKSFGYYDTPREIGTILMLIVTEISKFYDTYKLNKGEKLADIALRAYDLCGYNCVSLVELSEIGADSVNMWGMINALTCHIEAYRADIETDFLYIKKLLVKVWKCAEIHDIDLEAEITRKQDMISDGVLKKRI